MIFALSAIATVASLTAFSLWQRAVAAEAKADLYRIRSQTMHRRAQRAEGRVERARNILWEDGEE